MKLDDLRLEQAYGIQRRRLLNRAVHGWGVVYGLALERPQPTTPTDPPSQKLLVGRGLALDQYGREMVVVEPVEIKATNTFWRKTANGCEAASIERLPAGHYRLAAHYAERPFEDVMVAGKCGCDEIEKKFTCETVVFSLTKVAKCPCGEPACERKHPCTKSDACGSDSRGPHATLCSWVTDADIASDPESLCEWDGHWIDPKAGVDLGCVQVAEHSKRCDPLLIGEIEDACGPRRLVKNNDLLYDLIRGCDLTRIEKISWAEWHRGRMPWKTFADMFRDAPQGIVDSDTALEVYFSRPVRIATLTREVVTITVAIARDEHWRHLYRVPVRKPVPIGPDGELAKGMRIQVLGKWVKDEVRDGTRLHRSPFTVEIEIRGDFILDCDGQALDANARGMAPPPSGNGAPGGTFLSTFRVAKREGDSQND